MHRTKILVAIGAAATLLLTSCGSSTSSGDSPSDSGDPGSSSTQEDPGSTADDAGASPAAASPESDAWMKAAKLGPYAPESQDWDAIIAAAKEEGAVTVYSVSSRMQEFGEYFEDKYGIKLSFTELPSNEQTDRFAREYQADIHTVDVLYNNDPGTMIASFVPKGMVHNFVPDMVRDKLDPGDMEPLLNQRWTGRVFMYNSAANPDGAPIDNLWDLTKPEWKGKFQLPDPATDGAEAETFMTILQHSDDMAAAYKQEFGEELTEYSPAVVDATGRNLAYHEPNASIEWLYRILANDPVFVESTTDISNHVGDVTADNPPMGSTTYSKIRKTKPGAIEWLPAFDVAPTMGVFYENVLAIADLAPHPNAAKLVIREMMTPDGYAPWADPGDYAANSEIQESVVAEHQDVMPAFDDLTKYKVDPEYVFSHRKGFLQLYTML